MKAKLITFVRGLRNGTPPRFQSYLKSLTLLLVMVIGVNVWGAVSSPITLTTNKTNVGYSSSGEYTNIFDYKLTFSALSAAGTNYIQNAKNSSFYNTVAIPGSITSIKLTDCATTSTKTDGGFTIYGGTTQANCTTKVKEISGLSSSATNKTIEFTGNYTFFKVTVNSARVLKISSIVISFSAASDPYTVTFNAGSHGSLECPSCTDGNKLTEASAGAGVTLPNVTANEGWKFLGWATTQAKADAGTADAGNAGATYKPSKDITLYAVYIQQFDVKWYVNGDLKKTDTYDNGANLALPQGVSPTSSDCDGSKVFVGWTARAIANPTDTKPDDLFTTASGTVTAPATYYAVFANASNGGGTSNEFEMLSTSSSVTAGDYVIINSDGTYAMSSDFYSGTSGEFKGVSVSPSNNKVTVTNTKLIWTFEEGTTSGQFSLKNNSTNTYASITGTSSTNAALSNSRVYFTFGTSGTTNIWKVKSVSYNARGFSYYGSNKSFRTYAHSSNNTGYLYKRASGGTTYSNYTTSCGKMWDVTIAQNEDTWGNVSQASVTAVADQTVVSASSNVLTIGGTTEITATPNPQDDQYTYAFSNWTNIPVSGKITEDVTITANFTRTPRTYNVTYNMNGGGWKGGEGDATYTYGVGIPTLATTVDRTGYGFAGWYDNAELEGSAVTSISPTATGDKQFWAKWNVGWKFMYHADSYAEHNVNPNLTYTVHLDDNTTYWFRFSDGVASYDLPSDGNIMTSSNCTNWNFYRNNNKDCGIATTAPGDYTFRIDDSDAANKLVVSVTYPPSVLVTFDMNGHGANTTTYITPNTAVAQPSDPSAAGWDFAGWYENASCTGDAFDFSTTLSADKTLYAKWIEARTTLYLDPGVWDADNAKFAVYYFGTAGNGWSDLMTIAPCESNIYITTIPKGYETVNFVRLSNDATAGTWDKKWNQTANIPLSSDSWDKCTITGWGDYGGYSPCSTSKYSPTTFTVTCAVNPAGYGTVSQASVTSVPCGTSISATGSTLRVGPTAVTATPASPDVQYTYAFDHWDWTNNVTEVTGNITATAHFTHTLNQYTINALELTNCAVAGGSSWPTEKKDYGSSFSTTFVANEGYKLPSEISVTGATYTWSAGVLTITSVTGDVTVSIVAVEQTYVNYRTTCCIRLGKVQVGDVSYLTTTSAQLNWTAQANATSYTLVLDGGTPIENITENHYTVSGLTPGSTHSFTVQAIGDGEYHCDGAVSNAKTFYTKINVTLTRKGDATSTDLTSSDGTYSFPGDEADACTGWSFDGWSANSNVDGSSYTKVITPTHGSTYYAVYVNAGTYKTLPPCGPQIAAEMTNNNIVAVNGSWSAGLSEVALSAYNLTMGVEGGVTIKFVSTNDNFKLKANTTAGEGVVAANLSFPVTSGSDAWNQNIVVTYKPTAAGATETATITVKVIKTGGSTEYARTQFTVKGYSLPAEFVMATKVGDDWYTMTEVAAASGNTPCPGTQLEVDNITTPTIITGVADGYLPSITVFTPAIRPTVNANAECVRFESKKKPGNFLRVPDDNTYLYFNSENSTSNSYWRMTPNPSVEGEFYIALPNNAHGRSLSAKDGASGNTTFGHFKTTTSWRLLPLSNDVELCTRYIAPNVQVTKIQDGSNDVTLKVSSTNGEPETLGYEYSTDQTSWTAMSGTGTSATVTLTGLTKGTEYTYYVRGIVTDETENCSGEKEVTFSPFNPIVTVTPSSLDLTCLAGETDTKTLTITPNADAAGWTIGANPITGANASMFSFNAGTSEVTFSPAVGTADGDYTATLTIKSQAGNVSANVALTGTVVSLATQTISCAAISNGVLCGLTTSTGFVLDGAFYKNGAILSSMSDFNSSSRDVIDVASGESIGGMNAALSNGVVTLTMQAGTISEMVAGHVYRVTWENAGHDLTNSAGVEYANCYLDFVYSENCDAPTAMIPCVTGPNSAIINWAGDCDVTTSTVSVYTKEEQELYKNSLKSGGGITWNIWNKYTYPSQYYSKWFYYLKQGSWTAPTSTYGPFINKASTNIYLYTPQIGSGAMDWGSMDKADIANIDFTITVDVYCYNNAKSLRCFIVDGEPANTTGTREDNGKDVYWNGASVTAKSYVSETVTSENFAKDYTLKSFTVRGLTTTSRIAFCVGSYASSSGLYVQKVKIVAAKKGTPTNVNESCASGEKAISGLNANTTYFATVTNNGNTSNEVSFKTYTTGDKSLVFKDELSNPVTTVMVLGGVGQEKTITVEGTKLAGCDIQAEVSAGYGLDDSNLTFNSATGAVSGTVVLTLTDPTVTEGTFTITDGAGTVYTLNLTSSNCPAGINTMATAATGITDHGANANWSTTVTRQAGTLELYKNGIVNRELIENGGFETNTLAGWNNYEVGYGYSCDEYALSSTNAHTGSYCLSVTDKGASFPGISSGFSLIYSNAQVLEPGTYRFSAWVKVRNETGNDNKDDFKLAFTGGYWNGSSSQPNKAFVWSETRTVLASEGYVQLTAEFELSTTLKCHPVIAVKGSTGTFRDFWLDDVTLIRTSAPINDEPHQIYNIADLSVGTQALTDLSGNTSYSYKLINEDGCESNTITFVTTQPGAPVIEAESITLTASQDKTANGVIIVSAIDAYAPITITSCGDPKITLNVSSVSSDGGAVLVTFNPGSTPPGTSGKCTLSLSTMGLDPEASVKVDVNWVVTAGEDVNTPKVDVTEVWTDSLTIEHNVGLDAVDSVYVQFNREKTEEEIVKNVGDEIFFSKYYEATGDLKLWAIFNPTNDTISLEGMEVWRSKSDGTWNTEQVIDLSDAGWYKRGWISPQEEIIVYTVDKVGGCEQRHADMTTWWKEGKSTMQPLSFSGDDALLLVRNTSAESEENNNILPKTTAKDGDDGDPDPISWPDAITARESNWYMLDIIGAHDGLYAPDDSECKTWNWHNSKTGLDESGDAAGWIGYGSDMDNKKDYNDGKGHEGYLLSTNRCLLVRNKDVTSGANALAQNITNMKTLDTEWQGSHVPTSTPGMTQDSVSCVNFSYVGGYNYAGYYNSWTEMDDISMPTAPNPDGSWTVEVNVPTYSCKMFHIEAVKMDTINGVVSPNVVTSIDYKVPIVVDKNKATTADLFNFGGDTCATCDVVVRDGATLSHVTGGKSQFRELIVYPGAKFDNSSKQGFLLDRITVQSKNTEVGYAIINDNGSTIDADEVRHVKRVDDQHWYSFSLPYDCKISSIQQQNGKSMGEYSEDWVIAYYDGARRQADKADEHIGESSQYWIDMPSNGVLEANKAYIIGLYTTEWPGQVKNVYFPPYVAGGHKAYSESGDGAKTANIYNWMEGVADNPARNHGWNFVGSPYISKFNETTDGQGLNNGSLIMKGKMNEAGEITDLDNVYISIPADADMMTYNQVLASRQKILPFTGYFVQAIDPYGDSDGTLELVYAKDNRTLETPERRATATRQRVLVELNVIAPNGDKDNTGIWVDDRYTVDYEIGRDLMKIYGEAGRPQLYSRAADNIAMAYIALPDDNAEYIPLELYAPKAGKYTLKIDDNTSMTAGAQTIELLYNNATVADLFFEAYDIEAPKAGTIKGYAVRIRRWAQVITSDEQIGGQNITIIANDGQMSVTNLPANAIVSLYDVLGHLMATGYAVDGVVNFNAPATGVYNIVVESAVGHTTIKTVIK